MASILTADMATAERAEAVKTPPRQGFMKRLMTALIEARQRTAEREIERYIAMHGGVLTDSLERDISRTFGAPAGRKY